MATDIGHTAEFLTMGERLGYAITALPTLSKEEVPLDDACPICLQSFEAIYEGRAQDEGLLAGLENISNPVVLRGVTKLRGCGHVFCRVDIIEWIRGWHGTCPSCRAQFVDIRPPSETDDESSDGDYVPGEDDDEDDGFMDTDGFEAEAEDYEYESEVDGFEVDIDDLGMGLTFEMQADADTDIETDASGSEEVEVSLDLHEVEPELESASISGNLEGDSMENWGLSHSDGDVSESLSEGDILGGEDELGQKDAVTVAEPDVSTTHDGVDITQEDSK